MFSGHVVRALVVAGIVAAGGAVLAPAPASARVSVGIGIGVPLFAPAPVYYPPPPVYYVPPPPPVYYVPPPPPPAYYAPAYAPAPAAAPVPSGHCREYSSTNVIDGTPQQAYGTACLQPDGSWRIVN